MLLQPALELLNLTHQALLELALFVIAILFPVIGTASCCCHLSTSSSSWRLALPLRAQFLLLFQVLQRLVHLRLALLLVCDLFDEVREALDVLASRVLHARSATQVNISWVHGACYLPKQLRLRHGMGLEQDLSL